MSVVFVIVVIVVVVFVVFVVDVVVVVVVVIVSTWNKNENRLLIHDQQRIEKNMTSIFRGTRRCRILFPVLNPTGLF